MKRLICILAAWGSPAIAGAAPHPSTGRILADMTVLTADRMEGRRPGTLGERRTIRALIEMFRRAGLEPAGSDGWLQPVTLETRTPRGARVTLRQGGAVRDISGEILLIGERSRMRVAGAPVIDVGYGERVPQAPGAVLLYRDGAPPGAAPASGNDDSARSDRLAASGAAMALAIVDDGMMARQRQRMPLGTIESAGARRVMLRGYVTEAAAKALTNAGATIDADVATHMRAFRSANVIGRLRGAIEPHRTVVFSAHWDGFGRCRPGEPRPLCKGGIDNASGVAGMIELARWFAAGPRPERSMLFVATTGEESGLLGMRAYAARPAAPLADTVASINIDTIALYPAGHPVGYMGSGLTTLDPLIARLTAAQGRTLDTGDGPAFVMQSSDAWPMLRAGVPALILSNVIARTEPDGGAAFRRFITERAHLPADDMRDLELGGAIEDLKLIHALAGELARRGVWPDFVTGARFSRPRPAPHSAGN